MDVAEAGSLGGRTDPSVSGTPGKPAAIVAEQDGAGGTFTDCQVDRPGGPGNYCLPASDQGPGPPT